MRQKIIMSISKLRAKWKKIRDTNLGTAIYVVGGFFFAWLAMTGLGLALSTDTPVVAVFSGSMVPTFYKGDMIIVSSPNSGVTGMFLGSGNEDYKVGDIIVFDAVKGGYKFPIIHRIISMNADGTFETKGDANSVQGDFEHNVRKTQIHGRAVLKIPMLGWVKVGAFEILGLA